MKIDPNKPTSTSSHVSHKPSHLHPLCCLYKLIASQKENRHHLHDPVSTGRVSNSGHKQLTSRPPCQQYDVREEFERSQLRTSVSTFDLSWDLFQNNLPFFFFSGVSLTASFTLGAALNEDSNSKIIIVLFTLENVTVKNPIRSTPDGRGPTRGLARPTETMKEMLKRVRERCMIDRR